MARLTSKTEKGIPAPVMDYIVSVLQETYFGEVVLVAQDGSLIQVEHTKSCVWMLGKRLKAVKSNGLPNARKSSESVLEASFPLFPMAGWRSPSSREKSSK